MRNLDLIRVSQRLCANPECRQPIISARKQKQYCNRACHAATRKRPMKVCPACGESFRPSMRGKRGADQTHCSHACAKRAWWVDRAVPAETVERAKANMRARAQNLVLAQIRDLIAQLPPEYNVPVVRKVLVDAFRRARTGGYQKGWLQRKRAERRVA